MYKLLWLIVIDCTVLYVCCLPMLYFVCASHTSRKSPGSASPSNILLKVLFLALKYLMFKTAVPSSKSTWINVKTAWYNACSITIHIIVYLKLYHFCLNVITLTSVCLRSWGVPSCAWAWPGLISNTAPKGLPRPFLSSVSPLKTRMVSPESLGCTLKCQVFGGGISGARNVLWYSRNKEIHANACSCYVPRELHFIGSGVTLETPRQLCMYGYVYILRICNRPTANCKQFNSLTLATLSLDS